MRDVINVQIYVELNP